MWLSKKASGNRKNAGGDAGVGRVTICDDTAAVFLEKEERQTGLISPGGYCWRPEVGDDVLVIKSADGESLLAGAGQDGFPEGMNSGEVYIKSKSGAEIRLKNNGDIEIYGNVNVTGTLCLNGSNVSVSV